VFIIRRVLIPSSLKNNGPNYILILLFTKPFFKKSFKMQLSTLLLAITATLAPLAASEACVAGGPADQVAAANTCCTELGSTWYGSHANQGKSTGIPIPIFHFF
jgi:hypothetical protein